MFEIEIKYLPVYPKRTVSCSELLVRCQGNQWVGSQQIKWMWIKRLRGSQQLGLEATASVPSNPSSAIFKDELQPMPLFSQHHVLLQGPCRWGRTFAVVLHLLANLACRTMDSIDLKLGSDFKMRKSGSSIVLCSRKMIILKDLARDLASNIIKHHA